MPRTCSVCSNPARDEIDAALVDGSPLKELGTRFGVSTSALHRHWRAHIPDRLQKAKGAAEVCKAEDLIRQVETLKAKVGQILQKAESGGDLRTELAGVKELSRLIELVVRMTAALKPGDIKQITVELVSPDTARKMAEFYLGREKKEQP